MIRIEGLNKAQVLAALYNAASPCGMGFLQYDPKSMSVEEAEEILKKTVYFDYLKGRVMKVSLDNDKEFDERLYDLDNGSGSAAVAIDSLRVLGSPDNRVTSAMHKSGRSLYAADAMELADTRTTVGKDGITLGADELGPSLKEAVKKAVES